MNRHDELNEKRVQAVALFKLGFKPHAVATKLGISRSAPRRWYSLYSRYGEEAVLVPLRKNNHYPYELRLSAVLDYCEQGLAAEKVLAKYDIRNLTQLNRWISIYREQGPEGLEIKPRGRRTKDPNATETIEERCLRLELENEYLKKLAALMDNEQQHNRR